MHQFARFSIQVLEDTRHIMGKISVVCVKQAVQVQRIAVQVTGCDIHLYVDLTPHTEKQDHPLGDLFN